MGNMTVNSNSPTAATNPDSRAGQTANSGKTIFAGGEKPGSGSNPLIEKKRTIAGKHAFRLISNAFSKDQRAADRKSRMSEIKDEKVLKSIERRADREEVERQIEQFSDEGKYKYKPSQQEQEDLELLIKYQSYVNKAEFHNFTPEEKDRLRELQGAKPTDYQVAMLKLYDHLDNIKNDQVNLKKEIKDLSQNLTDMGINQVKSQDMLNAQDAAEQILAAADKDAIGMIVNDAKDAIDEKTEEAKEKGEKLAEEREKFEERIDEQKERRKEEREIIENIAKADANSAIINTKSSDGSAVELAQREIKKIMSDNYMLDEDIMGLKIDLGF